MKRARETRLVSRGPSLGAAETAEHDSDSEHDSTLDLIPSLEHTVASLGDAPVSCLTPTRRAAISRSIAGLARLLRTADEATQAKRVRKVVATVDAGAFVGGSALRFLPSNAVAEAFSFLEAWDFRTLDGVKLFRRGPPEAVCIRAVDAACRAALRRRGCLPGGAAFAFYGDRRPWTVLAALDGALLGLTFYRSHFAEGLSEDPTFDDLRENLRSRNPGGWGRAYAPYARRVEESVINAHLLFLAESPRRVVNVRFGAYDFSRTRSAVDAFCQGDRCGDSSEVLRRFEMTLLPACVHAAMERATESEDLGYREDMLIALNRFLGSTIIGKQLDKSRGAASALGRVNWAGAHILRSLARLARDPRRPPGDKAAVAFLASDYTFSLKDKLAQSAAHAELLFADPDVRWLLEDFFSFVARDESTVAYPEECKTASGLDIFRFVDSVLLRSRSPEKIASLLVELGALEACDLLTQLEFRQRRGFEYSSSCAHVKKMLLRALADSSPLGEVRPRLH